MRGFKNWLGREPSPCCFSYAGFLPAAVQLSCCGLSQTIATLGSQLCRLHPLPFAATSHIKPTRCTRSCISRSLHSSSCRRKLKSTASANSVSKRRWRAALSRIFMQISATAFMSHRNMILYIEQPAPAARNRRLQTAADDPRAHACSTMQCD